MDPNEASHSTTRYLETSLGTLSYSAVADIVAGHLTDLLERIAAGEYSHVPLSADLLRDFHRQILEPIVPQIAGKWRPVDVKVGKHVPPRFYQVPTLIYEYGLNLDAQVSGCGGDDDLQLEALAYAEGAMLHIHPFEDFNGRAVRAFLAEVLLRLDMPPLEVSVERDTERFEAYKSVLRSFDMGDPEPLRAFWSERVALSLDELPFLEFESLGLPICSDCQVPLDVAGSDSSPFWQCPICGVRASGV